MRNFKTAEFDEMQGRQQVAAWARRNLKLRLDTGQARVLDSGSQRMILNCYRQWGKSTIAAARALYEAKTRPGTLTVVVMPSLHQSAEFLRRVEEFAAMIGEPVWGNGQNEISLELSNGSRIVGVGSNSTTVRGFAEVSLLIVDDAARVSDQVFGAVRPMLSRRGTMWLMGTPAGKRGFFYEMWECGSRQWDRVYVPATKCPRVPKRFLRIERDDMGEFWFRQEYLCEFVDEEDEIFDAQLIEQAVTYQVQPLVFA